MSAQTPTPTIAAKQAAPKSWRDDIPIHPAADLFPLMSSDELRETSADIEKNGLQLPIAIIEKRQPRADGRLCVGDPCVPELLDGRNRLDAIELMTGKPVRLVERRGGWIIESGKFASDNKVVVIDTDEIGPVAYVISANIKRRHLKPEKKRELIADLLKADPSKSDRQIAGMIKASPTFVGKVRAEKEATGDVSTVDTRRDTKGREQPAHKAPTAAEIKRIADRAERASEQRNGKQQPQPAPAAAAKPPDRTDIGAESSGEIEDDEKFWEALDELSRGKHEMRRKKFATVVAAIWEDDRPWQRISTILAAHPLDSQHDAERSPRRIVQQFLKGLVLWSECYDSRSHMRERIAELERALEAKADEQSEFARKFADKHLETVNSLQERIRELEAGNAKAATAPPGDMPDIPEFLRRESTP